MGRPRKLSARGIRLLQKHVQQNSFEPLHVIFARSNNATEIQLSVNTTRRYMNKLKMDCYVAIQKPYLLNKNIAARVLWARTHEHWKLAQWSCAGLTDEAAFTIRPAKNRLHVWRHWESRLQQSHIVSTFKYGYRTVS